VLGIAREVAAALGKPLKLPQTDFTQTDFVYDGFGISVQAPELCPRYLGHAVRGITAGQSPCWMRRRLALCGLRSISNVVDITNYIMLEIGQPMHAFDLRTLESNQIIVRRAADGETITTLDGKEFTLNNNNLVICDGAKPVALAGVMGGLNSEITGQTTELLFESAKFARDNIRKTARGLGQNTDASSHYEKGISEYTTELGMARALHLIQELGCGEITATAFDLSAGAPHEGKHFTATVSGINRILGIEVPAESIVDILDRLQFKVVRSGDVLDVTAPRYREDIEVGEPDLAEEVIREYGYDKIVPTFLKNALVTSGGRSTDQRNREKLKRVMCGQGFYEVSTLAFYADTDLDALHLAEDAPERRVIRLLNPITSNLTIMRPLLAPSMLNTVVENIKRGNNSGRIFELSNIYEPKELPVSELPKESLHLGAAVFGDEESFFTLKGAVEALGEAFGVEFDYERAQEVSYLHPGISARILCCGETVGVFGKLANNVTAELKLPKDSKSNHKIFLAELDYTSLMKHVNPNFRYRPIPEFPTVLRDLALVVDETMECGTIQREIARACPQVSRVELFDIYRSEQLGAGKKSMAFKISFVPAEKPLSPEDVNRFISKILGNLKFRLGIEVR